MSFKMTLLIFQVELKQIESFITQQLMPLIVQENQKKPEDESLKIMQTINKNKSNIFKFL